MFNLDEATSVATRPPVATPETENWASDRTGSGDGTVIKAAFLNDLIANLRQLVRGSGETLNANDDTNIERAVNAYAASQRVDWGTNEF